jgi:hypothetical protein
MIKKDIANSDRNIDAILSDIRKRREKVLKQRDRARKKEKIHLSPEEIALWESEKRLVKSQQKLIISEKKLQKLKKEYEDELWSFIQNFTKANQAKRRAKE